MIIFRGTPNIISTLTRISLIALFLVLVPAAASAERPMAALAQAFPGAEGFGGRLARPPVYPAYRGGEIVGYAFFSADVVDAAGYSAKPLNVAIGLDREGRITGARIVEHHEPILIIGITDADLEAFVAQYRGLDVTGAVRLRSTARPGDQVVDGLSGATVSALTLNSLIVGSSRIVAAALGLGRPGDSGPVGRAADWEPADWAALRADGSIAATTVTLGTVRAAFQRQGVPDPSGLDGPADNPFIALYAALVDPARIGRNLLGDRAYADLISGLDAASAVIFVGAEGLYSFKGTAWRRTGTFDRLELIQGTRSLPLTAAMHRNLERIPLAGAPPLREAALFVLPPDSGFDPTQPWRLDLLVTREAPGAGTVSAGFTLPYTLPERYRAPSTAPAEVRGLGPDWREVWWQRRARIAGLVAVLTVLTGILVFQDALSRRLALYRVLRNGLLAVTLVWIGWYAAAQLSVINVLTFANALLTGFNWSFFLLDPLMFILWSYVAVALLFWGRGVFCGWLCPFGALQELTNRLARAVGIPQFRLPFGLNERLWPIKYLVFLGLFAVSLSSLELAAVGAEVEPFKTAITLRFQRSWPWLAYPLALIVAGLFVERFFCRYLCPLGAALAIPARLRLFQWLKRHPQCGRECRICEQRCPVQAIHPSGEINPNECIHCLKCQTLYFDSYTCPPMIVRRKRREARAETRPGPA